MWVAMMNQVLKTAVCFKSMTTAIGTKNKTLFDTAQIYIHTHISIPKVMTVKMCRCVSVCVERKGMKTLKKCLHSVCLSECEVFFLFCVFIHVCLSVCNYVLLLAIWNRQNLTVTNCCDYLLAVLLTLTRFHNSHTHMWTIHSHTYIYRYVYVYVSAQANEESQLPHAYVYN